MIQNGQAYRHFECVSWTSSTGRCRLQSWRRSKQRERLEVQTQETNIWKKINQDLFFQNKKVKQTPVALAMWGLVISSLEYFWNLKHSKAINNQRAKITVFILIQAKKICFWFATMTLKIVQVTLLTSWYIIFEI